MELAAGTRIGPYEVVSPLGAGGMGEVYRARDARLGRDVAIKVLPEVFTRDRDRLERFEREARLLASLNHPHVAAIYGVEEAGPLRGIVLELVEGPTLADRIVSSGRLSPRDAIPIARQLIDALDAAHERGIVHRDLKPANIKLTADGDVKVLDFGLAKAASLDPVGNVADSPTVSVGGTRDGMILGTAAYMSPEQARGQHVDKRTDVWAFGCVLYEMLAGRTAFGSTSVSDSIAAILTKEPDWALLPASTPPHLRRLIERCLEKEPKKRLRDIADAQSEIDAPPLDPSTLRSPSSNDARRGRTWGAWLVAGTVAAAAIVAGAVVTGTYLRAPAADPLASMAIERVTADSGLSWMPAVAPDGTLVAYASDRSGRGDLDIWIQQAAGSSPLRLTDDPGDDMTPAFSPDGRQIVYRSDRANAAMIMPALGGTARVVAPEGRGPRFSPDGTRLAYWGGQWRGEPIGSQSMAYTMPITGAPTRLLPDFATARTPIWAPDSRSLLVLARRDRSSPATEAFDWWWVPLDGGAPVKSGLLDAIDGLRVATAEEGASVGNWTESGVLVAWTGSIWRVPVSWSTGRVNGAPQRLALSAGRIVSPTLRQGDQLTFAVVDTVRVIERVSIDDAPGTAQRLYTDIADLAGRPSVTADGQTIVFEQAYGRSREIWLRNLASNEQRVIARADSTSGLDPVISADGRRVAYTIAEPNVFTGYVVDASGGVPAKLCDGCLTRGFLSDSRRILIQSGRERAIQIIDVATRATQSVLTVSSGSVGRPHASPDDRWLAFRDNSTNRSYVTRLTPGAPPPSSEWREVQEPNPTIGRPAGWSPDSRTAYFFFDSDGYRCLWGQRLDAATGAFIGSVFPAKHLHDFTSIDGPSTSFGNPITQQGLLYAANRTTGNIWRLIPRRPGN